jgi:predicted O-methyltransferase YrrM
MLNWDALKFQAGEYWRYRLRAVNEYRLHSPFVFELATNVLYDKKPYPAYDKVESLRKTLLSDKTLLQIEDYGAGSRAGSGNTRSVCDIANNSLKPRKYAQLLFRIAQHYKPIRILELGTSLGLTSAYLALSHPEAKVITLEGSPDIAAIAQRNFEKLGIHNIEVVTGRFEDNLEDVLKKMGTVDMVFIDGNHRLEPTLKYFEQINRYVHNKTITIFDDIYWSSEMKSAWETAIKHPKVRISVDLYALGAVFYLEEVKTREHFTLKY